MARIDKSALTKTEIVQEASKQFLEKGYSHTTLSAISKELDMSPGNLTFHFPTKEHLLAELVAMLCDFRQVLLEEVAEGTSSLMAYCLELVTTAAASDQDKVAKDFFLSAYRSQATMEMLRKRDKMRSKVLFKEFCPDWTDDRFEEAVTLVSGIKYATLMTTAESAPLPLRITGALNAILSIYQVPKEKRDEKLAKALTMDYRALSLRVLKEFREYVDQTTEQALLDLMARK